MQPDKGRRNLLRALFALPALTLLKPRPAQAQVPTDEIEYTDSDGNTPATLAVLHDGMRDTGGVTYQG